MLGVQWNPLAFTHLASIIEGLGRPSKRLAWLLVCAMSWAMWTTRNKFTIEAKFPRHPADGVYKCLLFLQLWRPLQKHKYLRELEGIEEKLKSIYSLLRAASSSA